MKRLTVDTSVFVAAIRAAELKHEICKKLFQKIGEGEYEVIVPYTVLVEIGAAIRRRYNSSAAAEAAVEELLGIEAISFEELFQFRAKDACRIAVQGGLRGMDAIVIQIAKENNCSLVTLDLEMALKARDIVRVEEIEGL